MKLISIPSAKRLISSMRDLGYEFSDAVAEIVDNSIQANATVIQVDLKFDGEDSYLAVSDNGDGMSSKEIQEAMRFGSMRSYSKDDLGKFGLGLKTASLSQCDLLTVSSRISSERIRINSFCWDILHINKVDKWEILPLEQSSLADHILNHLSSTVGAVVTWQGLNRLMNYQIPSGGRAENDIKRLTQELKSSLGTTFHRYLTGEARARKVIIFINGEKVIPWDPFCRGEKNTQWLDSFDIWINFDGKKAKIKFSPFILPAQNKFSSLSAHIKAGGLMKWNKQQGFYIYRAGRLLQSGGWCGLRTSDEHMKLARVLVDIPPGLDEFFKVNISKMKINFPREIREEVMSKLSPAFRKADEAYRGEGEISLDGTSIYHAEIKDIIKVIEETLNHLDGHWNLNVGTSIKILPKLYVYATPSERRSLLRIFKRLAEMPIAKEKDDVTSSIS